MVSANGGVAQPFLMGRFALRCSFGGAFIGKILGSTEHAATSGPLRADQGSRCHYDVARKANTPRWILSTIPLYL